MKQNDFQKVANQVSFVTIVVNILLSFMKLLAGVLAHSNAMISDSIHSASDVFSTMIVVIGIKLSSKQPDKEHPYGHERMECVAAIVLSMVLFMTGLGIGVEARAVIIFTGCFVATVLNTYTGIRSTNQTLVNVAKTCGAGNLKIFWTVGVPSAMPMIFAGLKTSMGSAWGTIVAAEMLASSNGLGYMIQMGRSFGDVSLIMAGIIVIGILGFVSSGIVSLVESMALKWRPKK